MNSGNIFAECKSLDKIMVFHKDADISNYKYCRDDITIYAYAGSKAEKFAVKKGFKFVPIDKIHVHEFDTEPVIKEPTCSEAGSTSHICILCRNEIVTEIPALEHTYNNGKVTKEASCTESGIFTYTCTACGAAENEEIPVTDHVLRDTVKTEATCTKTGVMAHECINCNYEITEDIPISGHDYLTDLEKATKGEDGYILVYCSDCSDIKTSETIYKASKSTLSKVNRVYNGKVFKPVLTVKNSKNKKLIKGTDYTVKLVNHAGKIVNKPVNAGKYKYVITFKGNYSGKITKEFTIKPPAAVITKLQSKAKKKITVKWKKVPKQITGYEIRYSTTSGFKGGTYQTAYVKKPAAISKTLTAKKSGKRYYVKIRTYKTVNGIKLYSTWSKVKSVKTK